MIRDSHPPADNSMMMTPRSNTSCSHSHPSSSSSSTTSFKLLILLRFGIAVLVFHQVVLVARHHQHHDANASTLLAMLSAWSLSTAGATRTAAQDESTALQPPFHKEASSPESSSSSSLGVVMSNHSQSPLPPLQSRSSLVDDDDIFQFDFKNSPPFAIFYNVYIPKDISNNNNTVTANEQEDEESNRQHANNNKTRRRARRIFQEQMKTVGSSYANSMPGKPVTVYYNTIGDATALNASFVHYVCTQQYNFTCRHLQHYDAAFEDVTLQHLYNFCHVVHHNTRNSDISDQQHDLRVVYMHNKGSFNKARYQNDNRRIFTQTVTSRACLQQPSTMLQRQDQQEQQQQDCNVCGHLFQPVWGPFFGGNFWVASCSYIRQLIPPKLINQTMTEKLVPALYKMQQEGKLLTNLLPVVGPYCLGTGRYSHEHWVAGHGTIRPCDVVVIEEEEHGKNATAATATGTLITTTTTSTTMMMTRQMPAPREHINSTKWYGFKPSRTTRVLQNKNLRFREYFLLPGYLFRLHVLYPQQGPPPSDSWVWTWFPDGKLWKDAVEKYGGILPAINAVTTRFSKNTTTRTRSRE